MSHEEGFVKGFLIVRCYQAVAHCVANQLRLILQSEFLHQNGAVVLNRPLTDIETLRHLRVGFAFRSQLENLSLTRSEGIMWIKRARLR
jgi:hypothetical protein